MCQKITKREENLRVFKRQAGGKVFFQPRIKWWYQWNKARGTLPEKYQEMSLLELFDELDVSIRYFSSHAAGLSSAVGVRYSKAVKIRERIKGEEKLVIIGTPQGDIVRKNKQSTDGGWRTTEFPIKNAEDLKRAEWLFKNMNFTFLEDNFEQGARFVEDRGEPQFFVPRSPYQSLSIEWMGTENLIYALADVPRLVERVMKAMDRSYNTLYQSIISYKKVRIINFGENIDANIISPAHFEQYCLPFYEKRAKQIRSAGIYTHIHIDGSFKSLLKYLKDLPFDGLEALTPFPQGDVTLEEMKEAIGEKILLDGIPGILLLPEYPLKEFQECVEKLINLFYPRLILGASDEVPPSADIERVRYVSHYCQKTTEISS